MCLSAWWHCPGSHVGPIINEALSRPWNTHCSAWSYPLSPTEPKHCGHVPQATLPTQALNEAEPESLYTAWHPLLLRPSVSSSPLAVLGWCKTADSLWLPFCLWCWGSNLRFVSYILNLLEVSFETGLLVVQAGLAFNSQASGLSPNCWGDRCVP